MMNKEIAIKIGGQGGQGVRTIGLILTKSLKSLGYWTFSYSEYPSLIRGGHTIFQINLADSKINSVTERIDILVALNNESITLHYEEIDDNGYLLCDNLFHIRNDIKNYLLSHNIKIVFIPVKEILTKNKGIPIMENSVIAGAVWALFCNDLNILTKEMEKIFAEKNKDFDTNIQCTQDGFDQVAQNSSETYNLAKLPHNDRIIATGNEIAGLSLYTSGCRFYTAYPMTPATGILTYLASHAADFDMIVKQAEDEISAVQLTLGANFAGTRAATGTSGGGLALMTETISLAGMTETPLVILNSQRPAPATGVPTWTEQGDLGFVTHIGHGDFLRIVLAPGDIDEIFSLIPQAFNLSELYQTVVIVLLDKYLSESWYQTEKFVDTAIHINRGKILDQKELDRLNEYKRYLYTVSGISSRTLPGMKGGAHLANSDEHDEFGYSTEDLVTRKNMMEKRMRKLKGIETDIPEPELFGDESALTTVITWGSQKGPVLDAVMEINRAGGKLNLLHYSYVSPFKSEKLKQLSKTNNLIICENNFSNQFARFIREETGIDIKTKISKYVGTPFFKDELIQLLKEKIT